MTAGDAKSASGAQPIRDALQAAAFLEGLVLDPPRPYAQRAPFALQAVRALLARIGNPQQHLRVVHIAGSKGKGSTALLVEAILRAAGWRTGTFTSPHLQRWTERFRIAGSEVAGEDLAAALERLRPHVEALRGEHPENPPSFFDAATAAALLLFREAGVDCAILEAGLGGRLDATNVVQPAVSCITSIELEHTDKLGDTLEAIAREKAGIVKPGVPVVVGALPVPAAEIVRARAAALTAPLVALGDGLRLDVEAGGTSALALRIVTGEMRIDAMLPLAGLHLAHNAALAVACVQRLGAFGPDRLCAAVRQGLASARLPGRSEILCCAPWVVVDAAHTAASAAALEAVLAAIPAGGLHLVLSTSAGRDAMTLFAALLARAETVTVTRADAQRSLAPEILAAAIRAHSPGTALRVVADPILAVCSAYKALAPDGLLCITGSVYMAGIARTAFEKTGVPGLRAADIGPAAPVSTRRSP